MENIISNFKLSDGTIVRCNFFDTNGTSRYRGVNESYYKKVDCCIIVYDITDRNSFDEIQTYYIPLINQKCQKDIPILIIGNKTDLDEKREILTEQGEELALNYNYIFKETSSINNSNILDIFQEIIENTVYKVKEEEKINENRRLIRINDYNNERKCFHLC